VLNSFRLIECDVELCKGASVSLVRTLYTGTSDVFPFCGRTHFLGIRWRGRAAKDRRPPGDTESGKGVGVRLREGRMEAKDWITVATSTAAIIIAAISLFITVRRERREAAATKPTFDLRLSFPANSDYCRADIAITSRQEHRCIVETVRITKPRNANLIEDLPTRPWKLSKTMPFNVQLDKDDVSGKPYFLSAKRKVNMRFAFEITILTLGQKEVRERFKVSRTLAA
jgi:hypothetical protein